MSDDQSLLSRRNALKSLAYGGAGTLFALSGGVFTPVALAIAAGDKQGAAKLGRPQFKPGGLGTLGAEQLAWAAADLKGRSASTPIVVFAHMPLWTIYEPWGWGTEEI